MPNASVVTRNHNPPAYHILHLSASSVRSHQHILSVDGKSIPLLDSKLLLHLNNPHPPRRSNKPHQSLRHVFDFVVLM